MSPSPNTVTKDDEWLQTCDLKGFKDEIEALGKELERGQGEADEAHLHKMLMWNRTLLLFGLLTLGAFPNPFTVMCLSLATMSRWTMIGHHVCHGGYDKVDKSGRYHRFRFAIGSLYRRAVDWLDYMLPEAWNIEHNKFHHYNLNEEADPDLVEENLAGLRDAALPMPLKYAAVGFFMLTWKWLYYSPNTFSLMKLEDAKRAGTLKAMPEDRPYVTIMAIFNSPEWLSVRELIFKVLGPYVVYQFVILPLPLLFFFGETQYKYAMINLVLAELLTNVHSFIVVVTNHAGEDLYRFDTKCQPRSGDFYLRQIIGSADFATGNDVVDFMHGFLNYQIEHHLYPALSMLSYQRAQPRVKAICEKYGVPYVQENVFIRLRKTVDIMVGKTNMRRFPKDIQTFEDLDQSSAESSSTGDASEAADSAE
jgi:fatty acid desaturase